MTLCTYYSFITVPKLTDEVFWPEAQITPVLQPRAESGSKSRHGKTVGTSFYSNVSLQQFLQKYTKGLNMISDPEVVMTHASIYYYALSNLAMILPSQLYVCRRVSVHTYIHTYISSSVFRQNLPMYRSWLALVWFCSHI